jgi:hypothetical protein
VGEDVRNTCAVLLPWVMAAVFWGRGLWRCRMSDCIAGLAIAWFWSGWFGGINALGGWLTAAAVLNFVFSTSTLTPDRPKMTRREMATVGAVMLIAWLFFTTLL